MTAICLPTLRRSLARALPIAALLGCGSRVSTPVNNPLEALAEAPRSLFATLQEARYDPPLPAAERPWFETGLETRQDLLVSEWRMFRSLGPVTAEHRAELAARSADPENHPAAQVDTDLPGLYAVVPLPPPEQRAALGLDGFLDVSATLAGAGFVGDSERARGIFGVLQIGGEGTPESVAAIRTRTLDRLFPEPLTAEGTGVNIRAGRVRLDERATALVVLLELGVEGEDLRPRMALSRLAISRGTHVGLLPPEARQRPALADFTIAMQRRRGIGVPTGTRASWPVTIPANAGRVELALGVLAGSQGVETLEPAAATQFTVSLVDEFSENHLLLQVTPDNPDRWSVHEFDVSAHAGSFGFLQVRATAAVTPDNHLPVVAGLRYVRQREPEELNVVLISLDTVRPDHLSQYGYERPTSPSIERFAAIAQDFPLAWSSSAYTLPSHASLFSGQYPSLHGVTDGGRRSVPALSPFLTELLDDRGYATAGFTGGGFLYPVFGFARGFDLYTTLDPLLELEQETLVQRLQGVPGFDADYLPANGPAAIQEWITSHRDEPFFLFAHTYSAHEFVPPRRALDAIGAPETSYVSDSPAQRFLYGDLTPPPEHLPWIVDRYDAGVRHADELVGHVLDALEAAELLESTIVVVTSDHGKELAERGRVDHGHQLHRELVRVPLLIHVPGLAAAERSTPASLIDVLPTVLATLGIEPPPNTQGIDLLDPSVAGLDRTLYAEVDERARGRALRRGTDLLFSRTNRLKGSLEFGERFVAHYDLEQDPWQKIPLSADPAELDEFASQLQALRLRLLDELDVDGTGEASIGDTERAHLQALGYEPD